MLFRTIKIYPLACACRIAWTCTMPNPIVIFICTEITLGKGSLFSIYIFFFVTGVVLANASLDVALHDKINTLCVGNSPYGLVCFGNSKDITSASLKHESYIKQY